MKRQSPNQWTESFSADDVELIQSALVYTKKSTLSESEREKREKIAAILEHLNVDCETIVAAILLIGLQNQNFESSDIEEQFSPAICYLAAQSKSLIEQENDWVDKVQGGLSENDSSAHHMMLLNMMKDARVVFIILANQVLIMQGLASQTDEVIKRTAEETKNIFAPLANRLGIGQLKWELEDLAFRYLKPEEYKKIANSLEERRVDRETYMNAIDAQLQQRLNDAGLVCEVTGRGQQVPAAGWL